MIWFKVAKESKDIASVLRLRHKVFVQQEQRFKSDTDYVVDLYDTLNETINILAFVDMEPIGTIRVVINNPVGLPAMDQYDFNPYVSTLDGPYSCFGWVCILQEYRNYPSLLFGLFKMAVRELRKKGQRHIIATVHPPLFIMLKRSFNATRVGGDFVSGELGVLMTPIYIDTDNFPPRSREIFYDPAVTILSDSNIRRIYYEMESLVKKGETLSEVFLIMRGSVRSLPEDEKGEPVFPGPDEFDSLGSKDILFHQGELFGVLTSLDQKGSSSTIIPYSKEVDVMVWSKEEFLKQVNDSKETGLNIIKILGRRFTDLLNSKIELTRDLLVILARVLHDASNKGKNEVDLIWLARQCGIRPKTLKHQILLWKDEGLVSFKDNYVFVLKPELLQNKTSSIKK